MTAPDRDPDRWLAPPSWERAPLAWSVWYARTHGHLYVAFVRAIDRRLRSHPATRAISADAVMHYLRWDTPLNAEGDLFKVNSNASALFARMFQIDRPHAAHLIRTRASILDDLTTTELNAICSYAWASDRRRSILEVS